MDRAATKHIFAFWNLIF